MKQIIISIVVVILFISLMVFLVARQNKELKIQSLENKKFSALTVVILDHQKATNKIIAEFASSEMPKEVYLEKLRKLSAESTQQIDKIKADYQKKIEEVKK